MAASLSLALLVLVVFGINREAVETAIVISVATLLAVGFVRFAGAWLLRAAKDDFQDSVRRIVEAEMRTLRAEVTKDLIPGAEIEAAEIRRGLQIGWLTAAVHKLAAAIGVDLTDPPDGPEGSPHVRR